MANVTTSERFWSLTDAGVIAADKVRVCVRKLVYFPAAVDNDVVIQEYSEATPGVLRNAIVLKANHAAAEPLALDFGITGRNLNGFKLETIDGGTLDVYLGRD